MLNNFGFCETTSSGWRHGSRKADQPYPARLYHVLFSLPASLKKTPPRDKGPYQTLWNLSIMLHFCFLLSVPIWNRNTPENYQSPGIFSRIPFPLDQYLWDLFFNQHSVHMIFWFSDIGLNFPASMHEGKILLESQNLQEAICSHWTLWFLTWLIFQATMESSIFWLTTVVPCPLNPGFISQGFSYQWLTVVWIY